MNLTSLLKVKIPEAGIIMRIPRSRNPILSSIIDTIPWVTLPSATDPLTLAVSPDSLGFNLTSAQRIILGLTSLSRGAEIPEFTHNQKIASILAKLTGKSGEEPKIWLPPDAEIIFKDGNFSVNFSSPITTILCIAGRRGGKTTVSSILMAWLARQILTGDGFLDSVKVLPGSVISLLNIACESNQARILFNLLVSHLSALNLIPGNRHSSSSLDLGPEKNLRIESLNSSSRSARG
jgi:hypothetical protein